MDCSYRTLQTCRDEDYESAVAIRHGEKTFLIIIVHLAIAAVIIVYMKIKLPRQMESQASTHDIESGMKTTRKLEMWLIDLFPVIDFPTSPDSSFRFTDCHICLEDFKQGETILRLPVCSHTYHKECIVQWMGARDSRCPDCRYQYGLV